MVESGLTTVTWSAPALTLRAIGPRRAQIDEPFNYRIEITNPGDQISRNVVVRTKNLDDGIEFISSTPKPTQFGRDFEWSLGEVAPGLGAKVVEVQLRSKKRGNVQMCFEVISPDDRLQTEACSETEIFAPSIGFTIDGPQTAQVGQDATFRLDLSNQSDQPLEDVKIKVSYDEGLVRPGKSNPAIFELNDDQGPKMIQFGQSETLPITFNVQAPGTRCFDVEITAKGVQPKLERRCFEAVQSDVGLGNAGQGNAGQGGTGLGGAGQGSGLGGDFGADPSSPIQLNVSSVRPIEVGGETIVELQITNQGNVPLRNATLTNRFAPSLNPTDATREFMENYSLIENDLFLNLGDFQPGQTKTVEVKYEGLQVDRDALTEFTVSTISGASASRSTGITIVPQGNLGGQGGAGGVDLPDFRGNEGIGIPQDTAPRNLDSTQGDLEVKVRTLSPNIRIGEVSKVQFSVTNNNPRQTLKNVNVRLIVPNTVEFGSLFSPSNVGLMNQYNFTPIRELRSGETIDWLADLRGLRPGQAIFEVQAISDDTFGVSSANDAVFISQ